MAPAMAMVIPPRRTANSTGRCHNVTNCAVAMAPPPAKMTWDSHSIPPSPVTTVKERKAMA